MYYGAAKYLLVYEWTDAAELAQVHRDHELAAVGSSLGDMMVIDFRAGATMAQFSDSDARTAAIHFASDARLLAFAHHDGVFGLRDLRQRKSVVLRGATAASQQPWTRTAAPSSAAAVGDLVADHIPHADPAAARSSADLNPHAAPAAKGKKRGAARAKWSGGMLGGPLTMLRSVFFGAPKGAAPETRAMCCSPDGFTFVRSVGAVVEVWDARHAAQRLHHDTSHTACVNALLMLDQGAAVASAGADCLVKIWRYQVSLLYWYKVQRLTRRKALLAACLDAAT